MRSPPFNKPRFYVVKGQELPLSGQALLELTRAVLGKGRPFRFRARGWSMAPFIRDGDAITLSPLQAALPGVGQVVAFVRGPEERLVVHRVIARRGASVVIQGDNEPDYADTRVLPENILGRVTRIERNVRAVWLGLGPERFLIAWLSRTRRLGPLRERLAGSVRPMVRRY